MRQKTPLLNKSESNHRRSGLRRAQPSGRRFTHLVLNSSSLERSHLVRIILGTENESENHRKRIISKFKGVDQCIIPYLRETYK